MEGWIYIYMTLLEIPYYLFFRVCAVASGRMAYGALGIAETHIHWSTCTILFSVYHSAHFTVQFGTSGRIIDFAWTV